MDDIRKIIAKVVSKVPDAQVLADLDAAASWAGTAGGDPSRLGITGFCWGGRVVWLYAAHNPNLKAGVAWYGRLAGDRTALHPKYPLDAVEELISPVLGLYGGSDPSIPLEDVHEMQARLRHAGKPCELIVYPHAHHGFFADYRPSYKREAAEDGWRRMQDWFRRHGVV